MRCGNDPLLGCYRTCKALQGPGRCFSSIQGSFVHSHANLPQFKLKILLGGGWRGETMTPKLGSPMGTRRSPTLNPTMGLLGSSLTFIFGQRIHPFIPSQPHHSLTCHPSNIQFVHPSGYSNATGLRSLRSHLYT
jgi:hypothetical protein